MNRIYLPIVFIFSLCFSNGQTKTGNDNIYFIKTDTLISKNSWILLLPGSSGLTIFNDTSFYKRQADTLSKLGFNIILVDYKGFYKNSTITNKPQGTTGEKIYWVIRNVIDLAKELKFINTNQSGHVIGWSLAGEGIFKLLNDTAFVLKSNITSAALFYPSNQTKIAITSSIPLLIQTGDKDKVTNVDNLKSQIVSTTKVTIIIYPDCYHGFDIESITEKKSFRFPPIVGKTYSFLYNKDASDKAKQRLFEFLIEKNNR